MLVRRYIGRKLAEYYAQPSHKVVGRSFELETAFNSSSESNNEQLLSSLMGEWHWKRVFQRIYEEREGHWLTPVELFQPHYSYVLGNFCAEYHHRMARQNNLRHKREDDTATNHPHRPFEIMELGGGRGTNAGWVLSYLKEHRPRAYSSLQSYTLVDSSPSLHQAQTDRFREGPHADKVRFELKDLSDVAEGTIPLLSKSNVPTVLMGMEVLDNLPHDKIRGRIKHKLEQAEVEKEDDSKRTLRETFVPLKDPLLKTMLRKVPSYYTQQHCSQTDAFWVPTIACGVLHHAIRQRPNLGLVLADFDWLPPPDLELGESSSTRRFVTIETPAEGSPIVTDMEGIDHESYLTAPPHCDILFPTDFEKLASFAKRCLPPSSNIATRSVVRVEKQSQFLNRWGPEHVAKTKSWLTGHTPLLHDFANCSVLTISPEETT